MKIDLGGLRCRYGITEPNEIEIEAGPLILPLEPDIVAGLGPLLMQEPPFKVERPDGKAIVAILLIANGVHPDDVVSRLDVDKKIVKQLIKLFEKSGGIAKFLKPYGIGHERFLLLSNLLGKKEVSAGAVLFNEDGETMIEEMALGHVSLPKGHIEKSDKDKVDTAKREIKEELGLEAEIDDSFVSRVRYSPKDGIYKDVYFYLGRASKKQEIKVQKEEVRKASWVEPEKASVVLTYNTDKWALLSALEYLKGKRQSN